MINDYNMVKSLSKEEFEKISIPPDILTNPEQYTVSSDEDIKNIERLLDVEHGTLGREPYYFENVGCGCGRKLTFYDFVFTALVDAGHTKSFVLHTLIGSKYIVNRARITRCSNCGTKTKGSTTYSMKKYACTVNT